MNIRVLVVDDFPLVREGLVTALNTDPAIKVVGEASNAEDGVELAVELEPDVVLLDMRMPGGGGMLVLERLHDVCPGTRVLVMTATEKVETLLEAVAAGAAGYLTKHAARRELCEAVITVHGGGSVIPPHLASHVMREFASVSRGETRSASLLTTREQDILRLVSTGLTDKEIGQRLYISARTVQNHLMRVREKTGMGRRSELARWAVEHMIT